MFFDNLQVTHIHGALLQEQSYYPFGLEMAGISDKALGKLDSKNKFNGGVEIEEDYGVNLYSTFYRQYDPQTGRFGGVDAMAERMAGLSPYQFGNNNPVSYNDPLGLLAQYGGMPERYIDRYGNMWHTPGVLHGIQGLESMPFSYEDEFNFLLDNNFGGEGGGPGEISSVKAGYSDGQAGFWVSWSLQGEAAHGNTLEEVRIARAFVPYNYYNNYGGMRGEERNGWDATNTTLGAFGLANGAKLTMLEGGAALNRGMNISKVNNISMIRTYGAAGAKYMKYAKGLGVAGSIVTTGYSVSKVYEQYNRGGANEVFQHRDVWDAGVGAIGIGAAFMLSNPVGWGIGIGVLIYGGATLICDAIDD